MSSALVMHVRRAKWLPAWALRTSIVRGLAVPCHRLPCAVHLFCGVVASSFLEWCSLGLAVPCFSARGPLLLHLSRALFRGGVAWGPLASLFCGLLLQAIVLSWGLVCVCRVYRGICVLEAFRVVSVLWPGFSACPGFPPPPPRLFD